MQIMKCRYFLCTYFLLLCIPLLCSYFYKNQMILIIGRIVVICIHFWISQLQFASKLAVVMDNLLVTCLCLLISVALDCLVFHMLHLDNVCYVQLLVCRLIQYRYLRIGIHICIIKC